MNHRHLLAGSVISVQNTNFVYPSCENCFSRLSLNLKRYICLKCGCSGDSEKANYRYRLSLEVADAQDVFEVTVFGSCLDAYFGVTARGLKRYIDKLKEEARRELVEDTVPEVVVQAAEACFVGKKFLFGIKGSNMPDSTIIFQNASHINRHPKVFTACHMFVPNPQCVGSTVIDYLQQHQPSHLHQNQRILCPLNFSMAFDQQSRELDGSLSNLRGSNQLSLVPVSFVEGPSNLWQESFGLTSSSVSLGTMADPVALSSSKTGCEEQSLGSNPVSLGVQPGLGWNLSVNEKNQQADFCLSSPEPENFAENHEPEMYSSLRRTNYTHLRSRVEVEKTSIDSAGTQCSFGPEKSWNLLPQRRHHSPLCSSYVKTRAGGNAEEVSWLWEELPSSESFSNFIANLECNQAAVSPRKRDALAQALHQTVDELHGTFSRLSSKPDIRADFINNHPDTERNMPGKGLPCQQPHLMSTPTTKESHQKITGSYVPIEDGTAWGRLVKQCPDGAPHACSKQNCWPLKGNNGHQGSSSKNRHSFPLKHAGNCLKSPTGKTIVHRNYKHGGCSTKWVDRRSFSCWRKQATNVQGQHFTPAVCEQSGRESNVISLLKSDSSCHQGSYNASADLFDVSAGAEVFNTAQGGGSTQKYTPTEFIASEQHACRGRSGGHESHSYKSSPSDQKTSTPLMGVQSESEGSFISISDFVPNSQFTPLARPFQQARFPRGGESTRNELPVDQLSQINARCKRTRPSLKNPISKCLVSKLLRSDDANAGINNAPDPQELFISRTPARPLPDKDGEEWIPPSENKWMQPLVGPNGEMLRRNQRRKVSKGPVRQTLFLSEVPWGSTNLRRTKLTPNGPRATEGHMGKLPTRENGLHFRDLTKGSPGPSAFADASGSSLPHLKHCAANWSPELFADDSQPSSRRVFIPSPSV